VASARSQVGQRAEELDGHAQRVAEALEQLAAIDERWVKTEALAREKAAGQVVNRRIRDTRAKIAETQKTLRARRGEILTLRDRIGATSAEFDAILRDLDAALTGGVQQLLRTRDAWVGSGQFIQLLKQELSGLVLPNLEARLGSLAEYGRREPGAIAAELTFFLVLAAILLALSQRARLRAAHDFGLSEAQPVWRHPWAMALILTTLVGIRFHPLAPPLLRTIHAILPFFAALWVVRSISGSRGPELALLGVAFLLDVLRLVLEDTPATSRAFFLLALLAAFVLVLLLRRGARLEQLEPERARDPIYRLVALATRLLISALALTLAVDLAGWHALGTLVGGGLLWSIFLAVFFYAAAAAVKSIFAYAFTARPLRLLRMVQRDRRLIQERVHRVVDIGAVLWWAIYALDQFALRDWIWNGFVAVLAAGVSVGAVKIEIGDVVAFALTFWLSFLLARFLTFVLQEDIFPRVRLARGVPYALSSLARYSVLFFGFLLALAAGGFSLDRVAFLAGGLGVGIGFGLQNVVNNFVSGLILLFERPVQVGDSVQLADQSLFGTIRRIGIRASVVRTWDGAEVIVPNGDLVSSVVTNWTLSDRERRLTVFIGVAYGSDPERVLEILREAAASQENILENPAPLALFKGFGDSSLDFELRVWVRDFDVGLSSRSALMVAISRSLREAEIEIPFPQRDIHVRGVFADEHPTRAEDESGD
jgi:small-conductance mechanosensitive channel